MDDPVGLRVHVDHSRATGDPTGVRVVLVYATGEVAEVQVAKAGDSLAVVLAGEVSGPHQDPRGHQGFRVYPTAKTPKT